MSDMSGDDNMGDNEEDSIISSENFAAEDDDGVFDGVNGDTNSKRYRRPRMPANDDDGLTDPMDDDDDDDQGEHEDLDDDDDDEESQEDEDEDGLEQDSVQNMVPIEFAKAHIAKIEEDMKHMHERHVKLMREMDSNYKMIEKET